MKNLILLAACLLSGYCATAQSLNWLWAQTYGSQNIDYPGSNSSGCVGTDMAGNIYITGSFQGDSIRFGNFTLYNNSSSNDLFLVKLNASGNVLWAQRIGGSSSELVHGLSVDKNGDVYITGAFTSDTLVIGSTQLIKSLSATPNENAFIAKYSASGTPLWATSAEGYCDSYGVESDAAGNVYIAGNFVGQLNIGNIVLNNAGNQSCFLAKYNAGGNLAWAKSAGGTGGEEITGISIDKQGNIFLGGSFGGVSVSFDSHTVLNGGDSGTVDIFAAKYDTAGNALWAAAAGGLGDHSLWGTVTCDSFGNVYVSGIYDTGFVFAGTTLTCDTSFIYDQNKHNVCLLKYDGNGIPLWATSINGIHLINPTGLTTDRSGNVFISGHTFNTSIAFSNSPLVLTKSAAMQDGFLAAYNSSGNLLWATLIGSNSPTSATALNDIACDTAGNLYSYGYIRGTMQFGIIPLYAPPANIGDVYIAKYGPCFSALAQPGAITGPAGVCAGISYTYSVPPVPNANFYKWSLPGGWSGTSTTNSITVTAGTAGGFISVEALSNCDTSMAQTQNVMVATPPVATIHEGTSDTICQGSSYSLSATTGTGYTYQWLSGSTPIPGATNSTHVVNQAGSYAVIVSNGNCSDTSVPCVITVNPTPAPVVTQNGLTLSTPPGQGSYQWYLNGNPISGATSNSYVVTQNGNYTVVVTNIFNCSGTSNAIMITGLDLPGITAGSFMIYPQPNKGRFVIELPERTSRSYTIRISNIQGNVLRYEAKRLDSKLIAIDVQDISPGVYFVSLIIEGNVYIRKMIVEK